MDRDRIEGGAKKVTGGLKETVGRALGDEKTEGRVQSAVGHVKDAVREIVGRK